MRGAVKIDPKGPNRAKEELLLKIANKIGEGANDKRARKTVGLRLRLGLKLRKKGEMDIRARERGIARERM